MILKTLPSFFRQYESRERYGSVRLVVNSVINYFINSCGINMFDILQTRFEMYFPEWK